MQTRRRTNERVRIVKPYVVSLQRDDLPAKIGADQVLIRCLYSMISPGTELGLFTGSHGGFGDPDDTGMEDPFFPGHKYPLSPGYAAVGEVEIIGAKVHGFCVGDLVYYPGRHQRYAVVSPRITPVIPVPTTLPPRTAPFARFAQIARTALEFSDTREGDTVAVIGLGLIGNLAAQLFRLHGASVIGADLFSFRRDLAHQAGIHRTIEAEKEDTVSAIIGATGGEGVATVIEATGNPKLIDGALRIARTRGEVILLGSPLTASNRGDELSVYILHLIHRKGLRVVGAHEWLIPKISNDNNDLSQRMLAQEALTLIDRRELVVDHLISSIVSPGDIGGAYTALLKDKNKTMAVLINWTEE